MLASLRITVGAVIGFLVVMGFVLLFVLPDRTETPDLLWLGIVLALGAAAAGLINTVGFRTPPTPPDATPEEAARHARDAFQSGTVSRMAMAEVPAIAALALAFVAPEGGYVLFLLGAVISLVLLTLLAWPSEANIARTQRSLERDGGRADITTALGG